MSMDTYLEGVRDFDGRFKDMMEAKLACDKAQIDYPKDLLKYFEGDDQMRDNQDRIVLSEATMWSYYYQIDSNIETIRIITEDI